jgi:arabinan endo-1,5-alpha-L-arabinosidase
VVDVLRGMAWLLLPALAAAQTPNNVPLHDPSRITKVDGRYFVYSTGNNISYRSSTNLINWTSSSSVFSSPPAWTTAAVPGFVNTFWAPDVAYVNGKYHLYYSVSTFGSQVSAIGLATNPTLNPQSPGYQWTDQGAVIQSQVGSPYNAIDPGIFLNDDGRMWMTFGSFWNGIYITELDPATGKRKLNAPTTWLARSSLPSNPIEAAYLHKRNNMYYLFVNWGTCCAGVNSTYEIRVGRSASPTGPFLDKNGVAMTANGGSLLLATEGNQIGPGHFSFFEESGKEYFSYHYYDGGQNGRSELGLRPLAWTPQGWPLLADTLKPADFNTDGVVDALDLAKWRGAFGIDGSATADNDGDSDGADFLAWQRQLTARPVTAAHDAAPEPMSATHLAAAACGLAAARRSRRGGCRTSHRPCRVYSA